MGSRRADRVVVAAVLALWALAGLSIALLLAGAGPAAGAILLIAAAGAGTALLVRLEGRRRRWRLARARRRRERARSRRGGGQRPAGEALLEVLDRVDDPVLAVEAGGVVALANASAGTLLDRPRDQLAGRPLEALFTQRQLLDCFAEALAGKPARSRVTISWHGSPRIFEVAAVPTSEEGPARRVVLTLSDVTELALAMKTKADFVANASHELRTPLAAISGAAETLADAKDGPQELRDRLVGVISRNAGRLEELLVDLLELSRLEAAATPAGAAPLDLGELLDELAARFQTPCEQRGLAIERDVPAGAAAPTTSRRLLEVMLSNLIDNATRFAREGTTVRIRARRERRDEEPDALRIEVADEGVGIPLADQQRIFERFYQVDRARSGAARRGTGLGLAIVKHAAQLLGGAVGVRSELGRGSTFWIEIPGAFPAPERAGPPPAGGAAGELTSGSG